MAANTRQYRWMKRPAKAHERQARVLAAQRAAAPAARLKALGINADAAES